MDREIRFLVATDVHLGHKEKHPVRREDSFQGFEEVLENAKKCQVDFLLLGGDLFDEVNPSKECFFRCLNMLRTHVFGSGKEVKIEVTMNGQPYLSNFSNQIVNITLPIFTIHGNHDYPSNQFGKVSACDLLQASNYVNYFGKQLSLHNIIIRPLIITKKGTSTKIALYGLGYIKDPILNDLFQDGKAVFEKPEGDLRQYTTIFVLHQNRYKKKFRPGVHMSSSFSPKNIPEWINLTLWGHEHQAIYKVESEFDRKIFQPGSTILTSFIEAESIKKQCALIRVYDNNFNIDSILLQRSFRPMFCLSFEVKTLKDQFGDDFSLQKFLQSTISSIVEESMKDNPHKKPIVRIKVEYTGLSQIVRLQQIESKFGALVANCQKIVVFWKRKEEKPSTISDQQLFNNIKNKRISNIGGLVGINEEVQMLLKQNVQKAQFSFFPKDFFLEFNSVVSREPGNSSAIGRRKCMEIDARNRKTVEDKLIKMNLQKEQQFKKAMRYLYEKKAVISLDKLPQGFTGNKSQFLAQQSQVMNSTKFKAYCKLMEEEVAPSGVSSKSTKDIGKNENKPKQASYIFGSRPSAISRNTSLLVQRNQRERSESEDCCERATKQEMDEEGNKLKFYEAHKKAEQSYTRNLKKNDKTKKTAQTKVQKTVRFSADFY